MGVEQTLKVQLQGNEDVISRHQLWTLSKSCGCSLRIDWLIFCLIGVDQYPNTESIDNNSDIGI